MQKRKFDQGLEVSAIGLGCMGMSWAYGPSDEEQCIRVLHRSLELGVNFWDTAELYGPFTNEELLGRALKGQQRQNVIIATKFAYHFNEKGEISRFDSSPAHVKKTIEGSLKRLGTDYIDLYYQHRLDPNTPIEDTVGAMAELVKQGKVRYIGLSEVGSGTIKRAHKVHPLCAVQSEYSLWERGVEEKVLPTLRELGIGLVAYSPMGRGLLTGNIKKFSDLDVTDKRRNHPRFEEKNLEHNLTLVNKVKEIALQNGITPGELAIAWLLRQGNDIVPIPGTRHIKYLEENAHAVALNLPDNAWQELEKTLATFKAAGERYNKEVMKYIDSTE